MKIKIFTATFNTISKTYLQDIDSKPLQQVISDFLTSGITPLFINQTQSGTALPVITTTNANSSTTTATPTIPQIAANLTITIFY